MELRNVSMITLSILNVFLVSLVKEINSAAMISSISHKLINRPVSLQSSMVSSRDNLFRTDNSLVSQLQRDQTHKNGFDQDDESKLWTARDFKNIWARNDVDNKRWPALTTWGKRSLQANDDDRLFRENVDTGSLDKRTWSRFNSWGKRNDGSSSLAGDDKRWKGVSAWGKRDGTEYEKKWKGVSAWGKRQDMDIEKKWKGVSAWGKRQGMDEEKRWKGVSAWGKRQNMENEKKWKGVSAWGKRQGMEEEKRWKGVSAWGKRQSMENEKKWKGVSAWGKRSDMGNEKKWKGMSVWGKRESDMEKRWRDMAVWGKRKQGEPATKWKSISAWGKRDSDTEMDKRWKQMSVWGKREDTNSNNILNGERFLDKIDDPYASVNWNRMADAGKRSSEPVEHGNLDESSLWAQRTLRNIPKWRDMSMWSKRPSWSNTGFTSWGKRSSPLNTDEADDYPSWTRPLSDSKDELGEKTGLINFEPAQGVEVTHT